MRRRELVTLLVGAAAWPLAARAQQADRIRRVAVMTNVVESDLDEQSRLAAFRQGLHDLGWIEEKNVHIEYRWTASSVELARKFAAEIVGMNPDVIFVVGTTTVSTMLQVTRSIPIVFVTGTDPVQVSFVTSLSRPGGNATGFADFEDAIGTKWLELLKEIAPNVGRVLYLHSDSRATLIQLPAIQDFAAAIGVQLLPTKTINAGEIERAFDAYAGEASVGLIVPPGSVMAVHRKLIMARAARYGFPAIYPNRRYTAEGGLMSYGIDRIEQYRRVAFYIDRILHGAKPDDLPVRQSEKFELVLNLKTAKALGLDVPPKLLARADEVIE